MGFRFSPLAKCVFAVTALVLMASQSWAHWYALGPSKDEWGLKYDGEVKAATGDKVNVRFTIANQGRLGPIHSVFVMAFSNPDYSGNRTYLLNTPLVMKPTEDGKLTGQVEIAKQYVNCSVVRVFTMTVDGKSQMAIPMAGARYYDIPLWKFLKKAR
ncbi:hypothetical protein [Planctomicrobium piriforme]|uniref:Uncharacterized protein n=1 Tax=Planctomicrobium piriforme TaxID=1576369 RepID=A0A1I3Q024_9PLAN|nr:hypothetical protein [Planctomicrobium piriforme]SFJ27193.1 hypothetical protein SAMN05421753_11797 [Planctomicrobium piriforme]